MARPIGRKPKLNAAVQEKICQALRAGNYAEVAAAYGGVCKATFYKWLNLGEEGRAPYVDFLNAVKKAESDAETESVALIAAAGKTQWQARAWLLERKQPDRWGRRDRVQQTNVNVDMESLSDEQLERIAAGEEPAAVVASGKSRANTP